MAGTKKETYQKRQKEMKRLEKQREKAEKRAARKLEKTQNRRLAKSPTFPATRRAGPASGRVASSKSLEHKASPSSRSR